MQLITAPIPADADPRAELTIPQALLRQASRGEIGETLWVRRPRDPMVAFGRRDTRLTGYPEAVAAAHRDGFSTGVRGPGGRVVAYTTEALVVDHIGLGAMYPTGLNDRFRDFGALFADALGTLGVDTRVGEVPGEYCPGAHSVSARGVVKLVGTAQRIVRDAWLFSSVVVVDGAATLAPLLQQIHDHLGLPFAVSTVGSVADEVGADLTAVETAVRAGYAARYALTPATLTPATLTEAATID